MLIVRLPRNQFWAHRRSVCPLCGAQIRFYDNIPLLSFLLLQGRCRDCHGSISPQYPLVEALTALLAALLFLVKDWPLDQPAVMGWQAGASFLLLFLIPVSLIDLRHGLIPDSLSLGGLGLGLLLALLPGGRTMPDAGLGALTGGGALFALGFLGKSLFRKEAMGGGDIKLMAMAGSLLGFKFTMLALFLGLVSGSGMGLFYKFGKNKSYFPFGPALAAGILAAWCAGDRILGWYGSWYR